METTPRIVSPKIEAFAATLSTEEAQFLDVVADPHGLYGWCSDGVDHKVRADGGRSVFGWIIWERPGILLDAEFHSVWQKSEPNHYLIDITPKPAGQKSILFVPDHACPATVCPR